MSWLPPVPRQVVDDAGNVWLVHRAWNGRTLGEYVLEVHIPGQAGVRAAHFHSGQFELVPLDDPSLPCLRAEARHGEIISYRAHRRAVIRTASHYVKVFKPGEAVVAAERCAQTDILLLPDAFEVPRIIRNSPDVIVFSSIVGRTLRAVGEDHTTVSDEQFALLWQDWSRRWIDQLSAPYDATRGSAFAALPLHTAEVEVADLWRWVNRWLHHNEDIPDASSQRDVMLARTEEVTKNLLRTAPDPLVWAHGDLHDNQILSLAGQSLGLLDFDDVAQAEAALDLAHLDVHLEAHFRLGRLAPARYLAAHTQVLAAAEELRVSAARFRAYADAAWLRLAFSSLPRRASLAAGVLDERAEHQQIFSGFNTSTTMAQRPPAPRRPLELSPAMNGPGGLL